MKPASGRIRLLRAMTLAAASVALATAAHLVGGGPAPGLPIVLVVAIPVLLTSVLLTAKQCRLPLLVALLAVEQVVLHTAFELAMTHTPVCLSADAMHGAGPVCASGMPVTMQAHGTAPAMVAAHALATVLLAWMLARGEATLWRVADRCARPWSLLCTNAARAEDCESHATWGAVTWPAVWSSELASPRGPPGAAPVRFS